MRRVKTENRGERSEASTLAQRRMCGEICGEKMEVTQPTWPKMWVDMVYGRAANVSCKLIWRLNGIGTRPCAAVLQWGLALQCCQLG